MRGVMAAVAVLFFLPSVMAQSGLDPDTADQTRTLVILTIVLAVALLLAGRLAVRAIRVHLETRTADRIAAEEDASTEDVIERLQAHRERCRDLAAKRAFPKSAFRALDRHIAELIDQQRVMGMKEEFSYLEFNIKEQMDLLFEADHVSRDELDHFFEVLQNEPQLAPERKDAVRERMEEWFEGHPDHSAAS